MNLDVINEGVANWYSERFVDNGEPFRLISTGFQSSKLFESKNFVMSFNSEESQVKLVRKADIQDNYELIDLDSALKLYMIGAIEKDRFKEIVLLITVSILGNVCKDVNICKNYHDTFFTRMLE